MATLSKYTLRNYTAAIGRLERAGLTLTNYDAVCAWVDENAPSVHSKKLYYVALGHKLAQSDIALAQRYKVKSKPLNVIIRDTESQQRLTATERDKYLPYDDICIVYKRLSYCPYTTHEDKLLVGFYTQMPPVRSDYSKLRVYLNEEPDMTINHIEIRGSEDDIEDSEMTVRIVEHKTASSSGTLTRTLPESLRRDVAILIYGHRLIHSDSNPEYLFDFPEYEITTRLQSVFLRYTGKAISVNIIRHAYITKQTEGRPPLAQLIAEADEMGHTIIAHEKYRRLDA
jgi:hypothetical protein